MQRPSSSSAVSSRMYNEDATVLIDKNIEKIGIASECIIQHCDNITLKFEVMTVFFADLDS